MPEIFKILSVNCRGLQSNEKRKDVFDFIRQKKCSIYCLQDTHLTAEQENMVRSQWGFNCEMSPGSRDSRGVVILFNNNFDYTLHKVKKDQEGNLIALDLSIYNNKYRITLISIYGPNQDQPHFFDKIGDIINEFDNEFQIICGDWNLVQNFEKDCHNYLHINNPNSRAVVETMKNDMNLVDPWRNYNENSTRYTWFKRNPLKKARLDFFLISDELMALYENAYITPGYKTDHSIIELHLRISEFERGKGFFKFNNSLLRDPAYVNKVKQIITDVKIEYAVTPYRIENIINIPEEEICYKIEDDLVLEIILMKIRQMTISYAGQKKN